MNELRKAAEMALEALGYPEDLDYDADRVLGKAADKLRAALAQPEQEPVAWMYVNEDGECEQIEYGPVFDDPGVTPLYTAPQKREWVGLADEEIAKAWPQSKGDIFMRLKPFARAIEAKLKEKNHD